MPAWPLAPWLLGFISLILMPACQGEPGSSVTVTSTDSAGVRITVAADVPTRFGVVDPAPVLSLGSSDATGPAQFYRIQNILVDRRGRLWVADGESAQIRIFEADGSHRLTVGGRGEGPGEFLDLRLLGFFRSDSVAAWDNGTGRLTVFDSDGVLVRSQRIPPGDQPTVRAAAVFQDGSLLARVPRIIMAGSLTPGQVFGDTTDLVRIILADTTRLPMAEAPGPRWLWTGRSQVPIPFTIDAGFAVRGDAVHLVAGPEFRVRVFQGGALVASYGVNRESRAVSPADVDAYRSMIQENVPEPTRTEYLSALDTPELPALLPAYSSLVVASDGRVWCQVYSPDLADPGHWDVFDPEGAWLGQVETPAGFVVMSIDPSHLTGVWRDELGVEYVRVYSLQPLESP